MTQRAYCTHCGLSPARVSQLVKAGMPLTSPEAADDWRRTHTWSRRPPAPPAGQQASPAPEERPAPADPAVLESTRVGEAYRRLEKAERVCWGLLASALRSQAPDCARLLDLHSRSVRHLADARTAVLDLAEKERQLVSGDWVKRVMQQHDGVLVQLIRAMPRQLSGRIAPHDPEPAENELTRWTDEVFLKTLHETDPWR